MSDDPEINLKYAEKCKNNGYPQLIISEYCASIPGFRDKQVPLSLPVEQFRFSLDELLHNSKRLMSFCPESVDNKCILAANRYIENLKRKNGYVSSDKQEAIRKAAIRDRWGIYD